MSEEAELFQLPDGTMVACGNYPLAEDEHYLVGAEYPEDELLEDGDIQKLLKPDGADYYLHERKRFQGIVINQATRSKCNASAGIGGMYQVMMNDGVPHKPLSDAALYMGINGRRDMGSTLVDGFNRLQSVGACPIEFESNGNSYKIPLDAYDYARLPSGLWEAIQKQSALYKGFEFFRIPKGDYGRFKRTVATALARRQPIVFAWHVGSGSMRLRNGYVQVGRGPGNHANVAQSAKWVGGSDLVHPDDRNSWGPTANPIYGPPGSSWGDGGFGLFTMEDFYACNKWHDYYVMTSIKQAPFVQVV